MDNNVLVYNISDLSDVNNFLLCIIFWGGVGDDMELFSAIRTKKSMNAKMSFDLRLGHTLPDNVNRRATDGEFFDPSVSVSELSFFLFGESVR